MSIEERIAQLEAEKASATTATDGSSLQNLDLATTLSIAEWLESRSVGQIQSARLSLLSAAEVLRSVIRGDL